MEIRRITWEQTIPIRHSVLWPTKPAEFCFVEGDNDALHFGAFKNEVLVCVASVYSDSGKARLRKFATKKNQQSQGVGSTMLNYILTELKGTQTKLFWCDARESAVRFYQRFGMKVHGERFYKNKVPYYRMEVLLSN